MCGNNCMGGNSSLWIILILIILFCGCGMNFCNPCNPCNPCEPRNGCC